VTIGGFIVLLIAGAVVGAIVEAALGTRAGIGWVGTMIVALMGAWIGSALFSFGPEYGRVYLISAVIGAIILVLLLKVITGPRVVE